METTQVFDKSMLEGFTGTSQWYKHWLGLLYTDGVHYVAEKGKAYWLVDAIASYNTRAFRRKYPFQIWTLKVFVNEQGRKSAVLSMKEDTGQEDRVCQRIDYTDFPLNNGESVELWLTNDVILLPSEN